MRHEQSRRRRRKRDIPRANDVSAKVSGDEVDEDPHPSRHAYPADEDGVNLLNVTGIKGLQHRDQPRWPDR
ncbi:hypothetical protein D3C87_1118670 [compost metagenome]